MPALNAPIDPMSEPDKLYTANTDVRSLSLMLDDNSDCSSGRNTLTSPALGFMVPTAAITSRSANDDVAPNARPVTIMSSEDMESNRAGEKRWANTPTDKVRAADPSSEAVTTAPIWVPLKPRCNRNAGKMT